MPQDLQARLDKLGIILFEKDPRTLTRDELAGLFGAASSGRIIIRKLVRSLIWHVHQGIGSGELDPIESNIRSFWYSWFKPIHSHMNPDDVSEKANLYQALTEEFTRLVLDEKLMRYTDFDFTDENFENRRIGTKRPHVLVFAEKRGAIRLLRRINRLTGCSTLALGGNPSALTSEYTARDIRKALVKLRPPLISLPPNIDLPDIPEPPQPAPAEPPPIHLIGIVDYDPAGHIIADAFRHHLEQTGLQVASVLSIIEPKHYAPDQIAIFKFNLPKRNKSRNKAWMKRTGGIDGQPFGLEVESLPMSKIQSLVIEAVTKIPPLEDAPDL